MVTTQIKANTKTVVNIKHKIENTIKRTSTTRIISTTKTIIKNTIRVTNMIEREVIPINRQGQEIQAKQDRVVTIIIG